MNSVLEVKKIDLWSLFKLAFFLYAAIGLIMGFFYLVIMLFIGGINSAIFSDEFPRLGFLSGLVGVILMPFLAFLYGIMGSVFATIGGWVYNVIASLSGGLKFRVAGLAGVQTPPASGPSGASSEVPNRLDSKNRPADEDGS